MVNTTIKEHAFVSFLEELESRIPGFIKAIAIIYDKNEEVFIEHLYDNSTDKKRYTIKKVLFDEIKQNLKNRQTGFVFRNEEDFYFPKLFSEAADITNNILDYSGSFTGNFQNQTKLFDPEIILEFVLRKKNAQYADALYIKLDENGKNLSSKLSNSKLKDLLTVEKREPVARQLLAEFLTFEYRVSKIQSNSKSSYNKRISYLEKSNDTKEILIQKSETEAIKAQKALIALKSELLIENIKNTFPGLKELSISEAALEKLIQISNGKVLYHIINQTIETLKLLDIESKSSFEIKSVHINSEFAEQKLSIDNPKESKKQLLNTIKEGLDRINEAFLIALEEKRKVKKRVVSITFKELEPYLDRYKSASGVSNFFHNNRAKVYEIYNANPSQYYELSEFFQPFRNLIEMKQSI